MKINIVAVGKRMPDWINTGYQEYAKRMPRTMPMELIEIPLQTRSKNQDINKLVQQEGELMLRAIPAANTVVALDVKGQQWDTPAFAGQLQQWREQGKDLNLLIGGPDGLASACLQRAHAHWSLSRLTLPHPLVRVIVAEQIYRAFSILSQHPYHR